MSHKTFAKRIEPSPAFLRFLYFLCGIVATIAYRIVIWLDSYWIQVAWYVGTIGFIIYFAHRTFIETRKANVVHDYNLLETVKNSQIPEDKKEALLYLVETTATSTARFNSLFIFLASVFVLVVNIGLTLWHLYL